MHLEHKGPKTVYKLATIALRQGNNVQQGYNRKPDCRNPIAIMHGNNVQKGYNRKADSRNSKQLGTYGLPAGSQ